jgi:hypothetical protein
MGKLIVTIEIDEDKAEMIVKEPQKLSSYIQKVLDNHKNNQNEVVTFGVGDGIRLVGCQTDDDGDGPIKEVQVRVQLSSNPEKKEEEPDFESGADVLVVEPDDGSGSVRS